VVCERLMYCLEASGILSLIPFCVNRKFVTSSSPFPLLPYGIAPVGVLPTRTPPVHRDTLWTLTPVLAWTLAAPGVHLYSALERAKCEAPIKFFSGGVGGLCPPHLARGTTTPWLPGYMTLCRGRDECSRMPSVSNATMRLDQIGSVVCRSLV
jgi:hypothetical protein